MKHPIPIGLQIIVVVSVLTNCNGELLAAEIGAGQQGAINFRVKNRSDSPSSMEGVKIQQNGVLPSFVSSISVPSNTVTISPGGGYTYKVTFTAKSNAPAGRSGFIPLLITSTSPIDPSNVTKRINISVEQKIPTIFRPQVIGTKTETDDDGNSKIVARRFRVKAQDKPTSNGAVSGLRSLVINGRIYNAGGTLNTFTRNTGWIRVPQPLVVRAIDRAGNVNDISRSNPDPEFIHPAQHSDINPLDYPIDGIAFSPQASVGILDTGDVPFTLTSSDVGEVSFNIYDQNGDFIKQVFQQDYTDSGDYIATWDGKDASDQYVPDGKYYYVLESLDLLTDEIVFQQNGLLYIDNLSPPVQIQTIEPHTPRWSYLNVKTNIPGGQVDDVKLFFKMNVVSTWTEAVDADVDIDDSGFWNVSYDNEVYSDGLYDIKIEATDHAGNTSEHSSQINIDREPTGVLSVYDMQTGRDLEFKKDYLQYYVSRIGNIKVEVTDGTNPVATVYEGTQSEGRNGVTWDGTNDGGVDVLSGVYYYKITSSDNPTLNETKRFRLSRVTFQISSPWQESQIRAYVPVNGVAFGDEFKSYKLLYGQGADPWIWTEIVDYPNPTNIAQEFDTVLGLWNTGYDFEAHCTPDVIYPQEGLNGIYTLKLEVTDIYDTIHSDSITVVVGRVLSNEQGGTGKSPDEKVFLQVQAFSMQEPFIVCAILPVENLSEIKENLDFSDKNLIGKVYEVRPPAMEFSIPAALEMNYTDQDLDLDDDGIPDIDETKLAIYSWDVEFKRWHYVKSAADIAGNKIEAEVTKVPSYRSYYAILEDTTLPQTPILFEPPQTLERPSVNLTGIAEEFNVVEIVLDGADTQTVSADAFHGFYASYRKNLLEGTHTAISQSTDPVNNNSSISTPRNFTIGLNQPVTISDLKLMLEDYSQESNATTAQTGNTLYLELIGIDTDATKRDVALIKIVSSMTDPVGIVISLYETGINTGIFRGILNINIRSDSDARAIGANVESETLTISSVMDPTRIIALTIDQAQGPEAPFVYSTSHPSHVQDTFEVDLGDWQGVGPVDIVRDATESFTGGYSAKITNNENGGAFSCKVLNRAYFVENFPYLSFDYKIGLDVKTNFKLKINGQWNEIVFTDDLNLIGSSIQKIHELQPITDNEWHSVALNLYYLLKMAYPAETSFYIEEIMMGDWDLDNWYTTIPGNSNFEGATYWIDNFRITQPITDTNTVTIEWDIPLFAQEYSYALDVSPGTIPDEVSEGALTNVQYDLTEGSWYFHVRSQDSYSNWGSTNHYQVQKDFNPPVISMPSPASGAVSSSHMITLNVMDSGGMGIIPESISLSVEGKEYLVDDKILVYDQLTEVLTFNISEAKIVFADGQVINVSLDSAADFAGNPLAVPYSWAWTYDADTDTTPPSIPEIILPKTNDVSTTDVTLAWIAGDPSGIDGYSFLLDQNPNTMPDEISEGSSNTRMYTSLSDGTQYYFHVRAVDGQDNWGEATHFMLRVGLSGGLMLDDFDDGADPNLLGGSNVIFNGGPTGSAAKFYKSAPADTLDGTGFSLKVNFTVLWDPLDYSGLAMNMPNTDLTGYSALSFYVKGRDGGEKFRVSLVDADGNETKLSIDPYSEGITTDYQKITIPLNAFTTITRWDSIIRFAVLFENSFGSTYGAIFLENIEFTGERVSRIVDNFDDGVDPNVLGGLLWVVQDGAGIERYYDPSNNSGGGAGYGYRITYSNVFGSNYALWATGLSGLDASEATGLFFDIKGAVGGEKAHIYLSDGINRKFVDITDYVAISTSWQTVSIPLYDFANQGVDIENLIEFSIVFEWNAGNGQFWIDNIEIGDLNNGLNNLPEFSPAIGNQTVNEGETLSFTVQGSDLDGDPLTFAAGNLPNGANFDPITRIFTWTPDFNSGGTYGDVHFEVSDGVSVTSADIDIVVTDVNQPPTIDAPAGISVIETDQMLVPIFIEDYDGGAINVSFQNLPAGATINLAEEGTGYKVYQFSWDTVEGDAGAYTVTVNANDGLLASTHDINLTVAELNPNFPPVISNINDMETYDGQQIVFYFTASDANDDPLAVTVDNLPTSAEVQTIEDNPGLVIKSFTWTPIVSQVGSYSITVNASDGTVTTSQSFSILVKRGIDITLDSPLATDVINGSKVIVEGHIEYPDEIAPVTVVAGYVQGTLDNFEVLPGNRTRARYRGVTDLPQSGINKTAVLVSGTGAYLIQEFDIQATGETPLVSMNTDKDIYALDDMIQILLRAQNPYVSPMTLVLPIVYPDSYTLDTLPITHPDITLPAFNYEAVIIPAGGLTGYTIDYDLGGSGLPEGVYSVTATLEGYETVDKFIALSPDASEYILHLNVDYRQVDEDGSTVGSTAAASGQMLLEHLVPGEYSITPYMMQDNIYSYGNDFNLPENYNSGELDPKGMVRTLNDNLPSELRYHWYQGIGVGYNFSEDSIPFTDNEDNTDDILIMLNTIAHWIRYDVTLEGETPDDPLTRHHTPAVVPMFGSYDNWMAIGGFVSDRDPFEGIGDIWDVQQDYIVKGFWVNDPSIDGIGRDSFKTASELINTYYLPMQTNDIYNGYYVSVLEPPDPNMNLKLEEEPKYRAAKSFLKVNGKNANEDPYAHIRAAAVTAIENKLEPYNPIFKNINAMTVKDPYIVDDVRVARDDYYLVPVYVSEYLDISASGESPREIVVRIDDSELKFMEASWSTWEEVGTDENGQPQDYSLITAQQAKDIVASHIGNTNIDQWTAKLVLREGKNPYYPEWEISYNGTYFYVTQEGVFYTDEEEYAADIDILSFEKYEEFDIAGSNYKSGLEIQTYVINMGTLIWNKAWNPATYMFRLRGHITTPSGLYYNDPYMEGWILPYDMSFSDSAAMVLRIPFGSPNEAIWQEQGKYTIEIDMVHEWVRWFGDGAFIEYDTAKQSKPRGGKKK